jgi:hypothetical protein
VHAERLSEFAFAACRTCARWSGAYQEHCQQRPAHHRPATVLRGAFLLPAGCSTIIRLVRSFEPMISKIVKQRCAIPDRLRKSGSGTELQPTKFRPQSAIGGKPDPLEAPRNRRD